jgi:hypothetical protein
MPDQKLSRGLKYTAFALLAAGLGWAIITHSLVAALARIDPSYALMIRSDDPGTLLRLADRTIDTLQRVAPASEGASDQDPRAATGDDVRRREDLRRWASTILAQEPGHVRALVILGQLKRGAGEEEPAATLLRASAHRSLREPVPRGWLINEALKHQDWPLVMRHADILMRMHPQAIPALMPLIAQMAESPLSASVVSEAVAGSPPWRRAFFAELPHVVTDARTPLDLLLRLKETSSPPTVTELRSYLNFLVERTFFDLAYYTWLQFLTPQQRAIVTPLFNGSFEQRPSGLPFDWMLPTGGTASVVIARRPDRPSSRALVVHLGHGRVELHATSQLLRLTPGRHRVDGTVMGEVRGHRGVRWRLTCLGEGERNVGESAMFIGDFKDWTSFSFEAAVPDSGCAAQRLSLVLDARTPSERLVSGSVWFDELSIRREPETASAPPSASDLPAQSQPRQR